MSGGASQVTGVQPTYTPFWTEDGRILFCSEESTHNSIVSVPEFGGQLTTHVGADPGSSVDYHGAIQISGTDAIVYIDHQNSGSTPLLATDGDRTVELVNFQDMYSSRFAWSETGHVVFSRGFGRSDVWAISFDPSTMETLGGPFLVAPGASDPSVSTKGDLLVVRREGQVATELVWINSDGSVDSVTQAEDIVINPLLSPDGTKIAFASGSTPGRVAVWIHDIERGFNSRLTRVEGFTSPAAWSSDSSEIAIMEYRPSGDPMFLTRFFYADGTGESRAQYAGILSAFDSTWSTAVDIGNFRDTESSPFIIDLASREEIRAIAAKSDLSGPNLGQLSPEDDLLVFESRISGESQVMCMDYPGVGSRWQVSTDGGENPFWSRSGDKVFFMNDGVLYSVDVTREPELRFSRPTEVFTDSPYGRGRFEHITPGDSDSRFIGVQNTTPEDGEQSTSLSLIQNWYQEFGSQD